MRSKEALFAGLVIGFILGYMFKTERVSSTINFPVDNGSGE